MPIAILRSSTVMLRPLDIFCSTARSHWGSGALVTKAKYGIYDEDVYNFNKAGFLMGKITTQLVVTALERRSRLKAIQPDGREWLLILDGHKSYQSLEFQELYKENNIYTLYMPPYSSHLLQPLDVGCFSLLKRAYSPWPANPYSPRTEEIFYLLKRLSTFSDLNLEHSYCAFIVEIGELAG
ncbi:hypothetical protein yc1106_08231 [Curvularia clavata]|uniref:DDE-1 domain-containing protein n=1 Tax=Curvularia clavata TaxID=95742 RepID=A0A9Q8ZFC0_CURCL|nr:hypothetical protein yc1106_08231 [Curvularia clavata]